MYAKTQIDEAELLTHDLFIRRLARRLARDEHQVDDIVQETWLAALRQGNTVRGPLRAWLARVVGNLAADRYRSQSRRERRELWVARAEAEPGGQHLADEASARLRIVRVVLALAEPYRTVIVMRYYDDLGPTEIAERLAVPMETVRTRTKRGLALLRRRFDRELEGERDFWSLPILALDRARDAAGELLQRSREFVSRARAAPVEAKLGLLVLAPSMLVAVCIWLASDAVRHSDAAAVAAVRAIDDQAQRATPSSLEQRAPATTESPALAATAEPSNSPERSLRGRVVDEAGHALPGIEVAWWDASHPAPDPPAGRARSDESGRYRLDALPPSFLVEASGAGYGPTSTLVAHDLALTEFSDIDLFVARPERIVGRVVDASDDALAGAQLELVLTRDDMPKRAAGARGLSCNTKSKFVASSDRAGAFEFVGIPPGNYTLLATHAEFARVSQRVSTGTLDLTVRMSRGAECELEVLGDLGQPLSDVRATVCSAPHAIQSIVTDATGRAPIAGQVVGSSLFLRLEHAGLATVLRGPLLVDSSKPKFVARMTRGRSLTGRVRDVDGQPLSRATIALRPALSVRDLEELGIRPLREIGALGSSLSDEKGCFELHDVADDDLLIDVTPAGAPEIEQTFVLAPNVKHIELVLGAGAPDIATLDLTVRDGVTGRAIESFGCSAFPRPSTLLAGARRAHFAGAHGGHVNWSVLRAGDWSLCVHSPGYASVMLALDSVEPGTRVVSVELFPPRDLTLEFVDLTGAPLADIALALSDETGAPLLVCSQPRQTCNTVRTGPRGEAALFDLPARKVRIEVLAPWRRVDIAPLEFDLASIRPGVRRVVLDTFDPSVATRQVTLSLPNEWIGARVQVSVIEGDRAACIELDGKLAATGLAPIRERLAIYQQLDETGLAKIQWTERLGALNSVRNVVTGGHPGLTLTAPANACRLEVRHAGQLVRVIELAPDLQSETIEVEPATLRDSDARTDHVARRLDH